MEADKGTLKRRRVESDSDNTVTDESDGDGSAATVATVARVTVTQAQPEQRHQQEQQEQQATSGVIRVRCSDGSRLVLSREKAAGTFFGSLQQFKEKEGVYVDSHAPPVVMAMVLYLQHDIIPTPRHITSALELIAGAQYFGIELLVKDLSLWVAKHVGPCTALEAFVVTTQRGCVPGDDRASSRAAQLIGMSLDIALVSAEFLCLDQDVLVALLSHRALHTALPEIKLHAAVAWVDQDATRAFMLPALLARNIDEAPAGSLAELMQSPLVSGNPELVTRIALSIRTASFRPPRPHDHRFYLNATDQGDWLLFFGQTGTVTTQRAPRSSAQNDGHDAHVGPRRSYELPPTFDWTRLSSSSVPVSLAAAHDKRTGLVVLSDTAHLHSPIICYCLRSGTWKTLPSLPIPRTGHAIVFMSGYVYAVGGTAESGNLLRETSRLRLSGDGPSGPGGAVWETVAPLHAARSGHSATLMRAPTGPGKAIVVFGGSVSTSAPIEILAATGAGAGRWKQIWMADPRHRVGHTAIAVPTRNNTPQLLVIGGASVHEETDTPPSAFFVNVASGAITDNPAITETLVPRPCAVRVAGSSTGLVFGVYSPASTMPVNVQAYNTETGAKLDWCSAYTEGAAVVFA